MKNGDIVFFQLAKKGSHRKSPVGKFNGHAYGLLLGHVPLFHKDPPMDQVMRQLGAVGYVRFDDIAEFLSEEQAAIVVQKFTDKYWGKEAEQKAKDVDEALETAKEVAQETPSKILNAFGMPTKKEENESEL
jgi:hypothetical protein